MTPSRRLDSERKKKVIVDPARTIMLQRHVSKIIRIQAAIRRKLAGNYASRIDKRQPALQTYFLKQDMLETLSTNNFNKDSDLQTKKHTYKSGNVYIGEWLQGFRHGEGKLTFVDGSEFKGTFNLGYAHGQGKFKFVDGGFYDGQWYGNCSHGVGTLTEADGSEYRGQWYFDVQQGFAQATQSTEQTVYQGQYHQYRKQGFGRLQWLKNNCEYAGEWHEDVFQGIGKYKWISDGQTHFGSYENNQMSGFGEQTWADGRKYLGFYALDQKCGYGIFTYADGSTYQGTWMKNKQHGFGIYTTKDGVKKKFCMYQLSKLSKSFRQEEVAQLVSGLINAKQLLQCTNEEWFQITQATMNIFYPSETYQKAQKEFETKVELWNRMNAELETNFELASLASSKI